MKKDGDLEHAHTLEGTFMDQLSDYVNASKVSDGHVHGPQDKSGSQ